MDDMSERKGLEQEIRESDEVCCAAGQRLSRIGSWAWHVSSGEFFWSQETFRIFGFDPNTTRASLAETFLSRIHADDRRRIEEGIKDAPTEPSGYAVDYRITLPDGSIKHIHDVVYPVTNETGHVVERYGLVMDVTARKEAGAKPQHAFGQMRALAAHLQGVREQERARVAREIHDELGQAMTAIKMDLAALDCELRAERKQ